MDLPQAWLELYLGEKQLLPAPVDDGLIDSRSAEAARKADAGIVLMTERGYFDPALVDAYRRKSRDWIKGAADVADAQRGLAQQVRDLIAAAVRAEVCVASHGAVVEGVVRRGPADLSMLVRVCGEVGRWAASGGGPIADMASKLRWRIQRASLIAFLQDMTPEEADRTRSELGLAPGAPLTIANVAASFGRPDGEQP